MYIYFFRSFCGGPLSFSFVVIGREVEPILSRSKQVHRRNSCAIWKKFTHLDVAHRLEGGEDQHEGDA